MIVQTQRTDGNVSTNSLPNCTNTQRRARLLCRERGGARRTRSQPILCRIKRPLRLPKRTSLTPAKTPSVLNRGWAAHPKRKDCTMNIYQQAKARFNEPTTMPSDRPDSFVRRGNTLIVGKFYGQHDKDMIKKCGRIPSRKLFPDATIHKTVCGRWYTVRCYFSI